MAEKGITIMKLKVDLQCSKCYKKVKKLLCKFPQIRDQVYDEKNNIVTIKVVCCNPEKIRDKLCCKGCGTIKSIEIVEPPKPKPPPADKPKPEKPPKPETKKPAPPPEPKPEPAPPAVEPKPNPPPPPVPECRPPMAVPIGTCCGECYEGRGGGPCFEGYGPVCRPPMAVPIGTCCGECYEGRGGGPCFEGYGGPSSYYGRPVYDSYGGGSRPCCECNTQQGCTIM